MVEKKKRGPLRRIAGTDASTAEEVLKVASFLLVPEDRTQRRVFETLMPYIHALHNEKYRWEQITKLLNNLGFTLQTSAVRSYYHKMILTCQDVCQAYMQERILLMAEIRKETTGADLSAIAGIVAAMMDKQRTLVVPKVGAVPGLPVEEKPAVALPAAVIEEQCAAVLPQPERKTPIEAPLRCLPLQEGVKPLSKRDNVPDEVYEIGDLEHPAVPGLMLPLQARLCSVVLEFVNPDSGATRLETPTEKRFRILWKTPIPVTPTMTSGSFVQMDESLFKKRG